MTNKLWNFNHLSMAMLKFIKHNFETRGRDDNKILYLAFSPQKRYLAGKFLKIFCFLLFFQLGFMVFVCVCVYTLPPWRLLPTARCLRLTWGVRMNDVTLGVSFQLLLPSSFISIPKNVIFHLERRNSRLPATGEKTIWYMLPWKGDIYWYRI